jgi:hypothetical protein
MHSAAARHPIFMAVTRSTFERNWSPGRLAYERGGRSVSVDLVRKASSVRLAIVNLPVMSP